MPSTGKHWGNGQECDSHYMFHLAGKMTYCYMSKCHMINPAIVMHESGAGRMRGSPQQLRGQAFQKSRLSKPGLR